MGNVAALGALTAQGLMQALNAAIGVADTQEGGGREARQAADIAGLVRVTNQKVRDLSHGLAPVHLNLDGLVDALHSLALRTRRIYQLDCRVRCPKPVAVENPQCRLHLYRIAQEAVSNAIKHGKATRIELRLTSNQHRVVLRIEDNGVGREKAKAIKS